LLELKDFEAIEVDGIDGLFLPFLVEQGVGGPSEHAEAVRNSLDMKCKLEVFVLKGLDISGGGLNMLNQEELISRGLAGKASEDHILLRQKGSDQLGSYAGDNLTSELFGGIFHGFDFREDLLIEVSNYLGDLHLSRGRSLLCRCRCLLLRHLIGCLLLSLLCGAICLYRRSCPSQRTLEATNETLQLAHKSEEILWVALFHLKDIFE
jgi:hypothetical protein